MRFNVKYRSASGYTRNTKITARNSEEAIRKFQNENRGATLLDITTVETTTRTSNTQRSSNQNNVRTLSPEERKRLQKKINSISVVVFSVMFIFFLGTIAYFLILSFSLDYEIKHLIYSILSIIGIALIIFLNIIYFKRKKDKK